MTDTKDVRLSIVLPAHNEQDNITAVIDKAGAVAERLCADHEIIVVDDGSQDGTPAIVQAASERDSRIRLVRHETNRGYGEALRTGFEAAKLDLVFFTDADNQFDPAELEFFLPWIDRVDVVAGYRINRQDSLVRRVAARLWNWLVRVLFYVPVRDIDCAFKLFDGGLLRGMTLTAPGALINTEIQAKARRQGARLQQVGVHHYPRIAGEATGGSPRVILRAIGETLTLWWRLRNYRPAALPLRAGGASSTDETRTFTASAGTGVTLAKKFLTRR